MSINKNPEVWREPLQLLVEMGYSQAELARAAGLDRRQINNYLHGQGTPSVYTIRAISEYCKVPTDYLLGLTDYKLNDFSLDTIEAFNKYRYVKRIHLKDEVLESLRIKTIKMIEDYIVSNITNADDLLSVAIKCYVQDQEAK